MVDGRSLILIVVPLCQIQLWMDEGLSAEVKADSLVLELAFVSI